MKDHMSAFDRAARLLRAVALCAIVAALFPINALATNIMANTNAQAIRNYLRDTMGFNNAACAAVLANIRAESGFNPNSSYMESDGYRSYGICQWHRGRDEALQTYCANNGYDYTTLNGQLHYFDYELRNKYPGVYSNLRNATDSLQGAYDSAAYFCIHFEVPANATERGRERGSVAQQIYAELVPVSVDAIQFNSIWSSDVTENTAHIEANVAVFRNVYEVGAEYATNASFSGASTVMDTNSPRIVDRIYYDFGNGEYPALNRGTTYYYRFYFKETASDSRHYSGTYSLRTLPLDSAAPTVSNIQVKDVWYDGYTVTCTVSDDVGVTRVAFPTIADGESSFVWKDGTLSGNTATFHVSTADHGNRSGNYRTEVYAYDAAGNANAYGSSIVVNTVVPPRPGTPSLSVTAGTSMRETRLSWSATANTSWYDIYFYNTAGEVIWARGKQSATNFAALLPAGSYKAAVAAVYSADGVNSTVWSFCDQVSFSVASASVSDAGTLVDTETYNGHLYALYRKDCTWLEAESLASKAGGNLMTITSAGEQQVAARLAGKLGQFAWLGAENYRSGSAGTYAWVTGEAMSYTNWDANKPDNWGGVEDCLMIYPSNGTWDDYPCTDASVHGYIAEFNALSMDCFLAKTTFTQGNLPKASDLSVTATFANGSLYEVSDFTVSYSGTGLGVQTMTIRWGTMSKTYDITIVEAMGTPDFTLPASLTAIESEAFTGLKMRVVKCPEGLVEIGARAFANCASLREIYIPASTLTIARTAFEGCSDLTIWGESGSVAEAFAKNRGFTFKVYAG